MTPLRETDKEVDEWFVIEGSLPSLWGKWGIRLKELLDNVYVERRLYEMWLEIYDQVHEEGMAERWLKDATGNKLTGL